MTQNVDVRLEISEDRSAVTQIKEDRLVLDFINPCNVLES